MPWPQNYDPLHAWPLSTAVSALPVLSLFAVADRVQNASLGGGAGRAFWWRSSLALVVFRMPRGNGRRARRARGRLRPVPDRLDHRRLDLPLSDRRRDRPVPGHERVDRGAFDRQADPAHPGRLLLRGVPRGDRRRRCAGGDRRLVPDRAGLRAVPGGDALPARQHRARGLGGRRQPDPRAGGRDRLSRAGP